MFNRKLDFFIVVSLIILTIFYFYISCTRNNNKEKTFKIEFVNLADSIEAKINV